MNRSNTIDIPTVIFTDLFAPVYIFIEVFYFLWFVYFAKEIRYLRKKLWRISHGPSTYENDSLYLKYKAEYFKHVIMIFLTVTESLSLLPFFIEILIQAFVNKHKHEHTMEFILILSQVVCFSLAYIPFLTTVYLLGVLTSFHIDIFYNSFDLIIVKQKLKFILVLSSILLVLTLSVVGSNISQLIAVVLISYYLRDLASKSKHFYAILRIRYSDSLLEHDNVPLQRAQRRNALRYKYINRLVLFSFFIFTVSFWLLFFTCLLYPFTAHWLGSLLGIEGAIKIIHLACIVSWTRLVILSLNTSALFILILTFVGFSIVYLAKSFRIYS